MELFITRLSLVLDVLSFIFKSLEVMLCGGEPLPKLALESDQPLNDFTELLDV